MPVDQRQPPSANPLPARASAREDRAGRRRSCADAHEPLRSGRGELVVGGAIRRVAGLLEVAICVDAVAGTGASARTAKETV